MSTFIILPCGNAVSNSVFRSVLLFEGKCVICRDAQNRSIVFVKVVDVVKGRRVRDILIKFMTEIHGIPQPDWSFLTDDEEAVTK